MRYEPGKVSFVSRFLEESLSIDVEEGQHIHFGVYLYDVEDEVEIVNTFVHGDWLWLLQFIYGLPTLRIDAGCIFKLLIEL